MAFSKRNLEDVATIFTRIIRGEIPGTFVWKDDTCVAFMSINPLAVGHTLVVPRTEADHWIHLSRQQSQHLFDVAHVIGTAMHRTFQCERIGIIIAGYEVPHTHLHVIPTTSMAELDFRNAQVSVTREELDHAAGLLRTTLREMGEASTSE